MGHYGEKSLILAIDQGTTGSTAVFLDVSNPHAPEVSAKASYEFPQHFPKPGWVEHHLEDIWQSVIRSIHAAAEKIGGSAVWPKVRAIGMTNQRETLCLFDRKTSKAAHPAIVWQCRRSTDICQELKQRGHETGVRAKTGLLLDPYFSATKLTWILRHRQDLAKTLSTGRLGIGTIDTYLLHRLTGGRSFCTDASNASRTLLYDLHKNQWSEDLKEVFELPKTLELPEVRPSAGEFGRTIDIDGIPAGIPILGVLGDQQAALAGQACFKVGEAKCTYGTGAFLLINSGGLVPKAPDGILTTVAWNLNGQVTYALEGASFIAGAAVQYLRDQLGLVASSHETESLAKEGKASPDVYFVPALTGLGAPWWEPRARGALLGIHRGTSRSDVVRAVLEGVAFQVSDLVAAMTQTGEVPVSVLRVDGGASANHFLMQTQADLLQVIVDRPKQIESTALGAALFAALGAGVYKNLNDVAKARSSDVIFKPKSSQDFLRDMALARQGWTRAIEAVRYFAAGNR